jgi:spore maturation protein CgeB
MDSLSDIVRKMRGDWDRRVALDYRFWMSEAYRSDDDMWSAGKRDFDVVVGSYQVPSDGVVVEVGCGVGRLLRFAAEACSQVIGIDVSWEAVQKAKTLLDNTPNLEVLLSDGLSLHQIPSERADFVYSFAVLGCLPAGIFVSYLSEISRILRNNARAHLQLYIGEEQVVAEADTLGLRSYNSERLNTVLEDCGFKVIQVRELSLPYQVSFPGIGLHAVVVELEKVAPYSGLNQLELVQRLRSTPEPTEIIEPDMGLESWVAYQHGCALIKEGDLAEAKRVLRYALSVAKADSSDIRDALDSVVTSCKPSPGTAMYYENMVVLKKRFPEVVDAIEHADTDHVTIDTTPEGVVIMVAGLALDHPTQPAKGALRWAEQVPLDQKHIWIAGFGGGYHIEEFLKITASREIEVNVWEPDPGVIKAAICCRDLRNLLEKISCLRTGEQISHEDSERLYGSIVARPQTKMRHGSFIEELNQAVKGREALSKYNPSISILGPLQGGTLPILHNVHSSLLRLKQRSRMIDMSMFAGVYGQIDAGFKNEGRKSALHQTMMGFFSNYVVSMVAEAPTDILLSMALAPVSPEALRAIRSSGVITAIWFVEDYLRFTYWQQYAQCYDYVFTIQKGACFDAFKGAGIDNVIYLPCACDPQLHRPLELTVEEKERFGSPVSFVGAGYHNRRSMFLHLADLPFRIWGTEWPAARPFDRLVAEEGRRVTPEEYVRIFNATDINLNLHSCPERDGVDPGGDFVNPRTFELAACGAFQLVDARVHLPECFEIGKEIVVFRNLEELRTQIHYFLEHEKERKEIAQRARARALSEHTYEHRMRTMLLHIYADNFEKLRARHDGNGWKKMMKRLSPDSELYRRCEEGYNNGYEPTLDGLAAGIMLGQGELSETEQKLLFLFHIRQQMILMKNEEIGQVGRRLT